MQFRELTLLALSASPPFPLYFVVVATLTAAALPPLVRHYQNQGWRIPLWHFFLFNAWIATVCLLGGEHMKERHLVDRMYWLYDHGFMFGPGKPTQADLDRIEYSSVIWIAFELGIHSFVPVSIVAAISFVLTKHLWARRSVGRKGKR